MVVIGAEESTPGKANLDVSPTSPITVIAPAKHQYAPPHEEMISNPIRYMPSCAAGARVANTAVSICRIIKRITPTPASTKYLELVPNTDIYIVVAVDVRR
jgi:hypothetical protein